MTENLRIPNLVFRGFQIALCLANWALAITYFVLTYSYYAPPVLWVQMCGIGPLTLIWLFYIMIEPRRAPKKTNAIATLVCEIIVNALWLLFFLWPTVVNIRRCYSCYGVNPLFFGLGIAAWISFIVTTSLVIASAVPLYKKGVLKQAQARVGGTLYLPEEVEEVEVEQVAEVVEVEVESKQIDSTNDN